MTIPDLLETLRATPHAAAAPVACWVLARDRGGWALAPLTAVATTRGQGRPVVVLCGASWTAPHRRGGGRQAPD